MNKRVLIGIDVGSGSTKTSAFGLNGMLLAEASSSYQPNIPEPGVASYDPEIILTAAVTTLAEVVRALAGSQVLAITVDAMISGTVALAKDGTALGGYTTTLDTRFTPELDAILAAHERQIRLLTGSGQPTLAPKIAWMRREFPELVKKAETFVLAGGLVGGYLAGLRAEDAFIDTSCLWSTGLADTANVTWSTELTESLAIPPKILPRIVQPTTVIGGLSKEIANFVGLPFGLPIVAGAGDQSAGYVGSGAARAGRAADSAGTYAVVAAVAPRFISFTEQDAPDVIPVASGSLVALQSMVIGGGLTRAWAADLLGVGEESEEVLLANNAGSRGVRFVPHLGGMAYPPRTHVRGAWHGLAWAHSRVDLYQAVLEAVAFANAHALQRMGEISPETSIHTVTVYGGGARSRAWNQLKADISGIRYESLGEAPVTALGAAMLGGQGVGIIADATETCANLRQVQDVYLPRPANSEAYRALLAEHIELVTQLSSQHF